ncbi:MAG: thiamine pyrophosphate-dependent enzyme [Ignavibacteriaceae bacterium]
MDKLLLLGAEAIAQGAIDGGMSGVYAYPGTPSTEITEYIQSSKTAKTKGLHSKWSTNEKTAVEAALGMSYAGKRSMACMKHVGLNVAADPFMNSTITGVNGGMIIVSADDPSMHSSQNEQDSRCFGNFALMPILEPSNQQEAYDMAYEGFDFSEKYQVPVLMRITTRLSHSRASVNLSPEKPENILSLPKDPIQFVLLPANARKRYKLLLDIYSRLEKDSDTSKFNKLYNLPESGKAELGIIACGIAYNYLMENLNEKEEKYPVLKIGQYPPPKKMIGELYSKCEKILVLEDGYPIIEESLRGLLNLEKKIKGRLDGTIPRDGELNPDIVGAALGKKKPEYFKIPGVVANRPPELCNGCSHRDIYNALNVVIDEFGHNRVFSDIGCYTLGALPPFNSINSCVDMGASITMAKGAADAGLHPSFAVIGDSTFAHSGITSLLDAVNENSPITVIISDNGTTGMTGGQESSATGKIEDICAGIGVDPEHIKIVTPLRKNHEDLVETLRKEAEYQGVSVIIARRECIQTASRTKKAEAVKAKEKK